MSNTEISESIAIILVTTVKQPMFLCCIVGKESSNLIFLYEMGLSGAQLSDKNRGVPRGQAARLWSHPAAGWQPRHTLASRASPPNHSCLSRSCKFLEFLNEIRNSASKIGVDADFRSHVLAAHLSSFPPLCIRQMFPCQGGQTRSEWCSSKLVSRNKGGGYYLNESGWKTTNKSKK